MDKSEKKLLRQVLKQATPGPWFNGHRGGQCHIKHKHGKGDCVYDLTLNPADDWVETTSPDHSLFGYDYDNVFFTRKSDAFLVAKAPEWLAQLEKENRTLAAKIQKLERENHLLRADKEVLIQALEHIRDGAMSMYASVHQMVSHFISTAHDALERISRK